MKFVKIALFAILAATLLSGCVFRTVGTVLDFATGVQNDSDKEQKEKVLKEPKTSQG